MKERVMKTKLMPAIKPFKLPSAVMTAEYCDAFQSFEIWAGSYKIWLGDANPQQKFENSNFALFERLQDRIMGMALAADELAGSTATYQSMIPKEHWSPYFIGCLKLKLTFDDYSEAWISDMFLTAPIKEAEPDEDSEFLPAVQVELEKWGFELTREAVDLAVECLLPLHGIKQA